MPAPFSVVQGNARVIVLTEGVAAIAFQWSDIYLPLYMLALGASEIQVGLLASVFILTQFLSSFFGGYIADRFGRKHVLVVVDILCWAVPFFLYTIASNPWYFLVGRFISGFINMVMPAFQCLFVEDVPVEHRPAVFSMLQFAYAVASLFAPLAGLLVGQLGIVTAGRIIMAACTFTNLATPLYRLFALQETSIGKERMAATSSQPVGEIFREYARTVASIGKDNLLRTFLSVRTLVTFNTTMWATYAMIYLTDPQGVGLPKPSIAYLPFITALTTIAVIFLISRRSRKPSVLTNLLIGQGMWLASAIFFVTSPAGTIWFAIFSTFLGAISLVLFQPANQTFWANIVEDRQRAQVFSAGTALSTFFSLAAGPLAGVLYTVLPRLPFILAIVMQAVALGLMLTLKDRQTGLTPANLPGNI
jgi:DHA1 family tetracycline resistance protein-like MFS transporter